MGDVWYVLLRLKIRDSGGFIETRDAPRGLPFWGKPPS